MTHERLVRVALSMDQSRRLRFIQARMKYDPPLSGLVATAVEGWLEGQFSDPEMKEAWAQEARKHLRVVQP